jgi:uncharacterized protein YhbP (UPF0306 family)
VEVKKLIEKYLSEAQVMQLATTANDQPWACSVHFVADDNLNLYWISSPIRRHSQEIANNSKVAATIPIKFPEHPVVGISVEGEATIVSTADAINLYDSKFGLSDGFKEKLQSGEADEKMYVLRPKGFVLFDQVNFKDNPHQEFKPARSS